MHVVHIFVSPSTLIRGAMQLYLLQLERNILPAATFILKSLTNSNLPQICFLENTVATELVMVFLQKHVN
jgi:hypothetical protein